MLRRFFVVVSVLYRPLNADNNFENIRLFVCTRIYDAYFMYTHAMWYALSPRLNFSRCADYTTDKVRLCGESIILTKAYYTIRRKYMIKLYIRTYIRTLVRFLLIFVPVYHMWIFIYSKIIMCWRIFYLW